MKFSQIVVLLQVLFMGFGNSIDFVPGLTSTCPSKCGNVSIPFPFGIEEGCYLDKSYYIECNSTTQIPLLFSSNYVLLFSPLYYLEVLEIKLDGELRVALPTAYFWQENKGINLSLTVVDTSRFPFSSTQNLLTGVGCDVEAQLTAQPKFTLCQSNCTHPQDLKNGTCEGSGCCQVSIPESVEFAMISAIVNDYREIQDDDKHGYAFIVEKGEYTFNTVDLSTKSFKTSFPVVLDWSVGNTTCEEARNGNGTYLCQENSECHNGEDGLSGYHCKCSHGYSGNPYIANGCQDVDECESAEHNDCSPGHCENTSGSYICVCPKGHQGNAKEGRECTPVEQKQKQKSEGRSTIEGISEGILGAALAMILVYWGARKRLRIKGRKDFFKQNGGILLQKTLFMCDDPVNNAKIFTEEELKRATDKFNEANVIGQGGYGTVYKGILENKTMVAIKKSKTIDQSQIKQFVNEVIILSRINHPNIVKLLGCCLETQVPFIVYEYITNDTLCHHIHTHATLTFKKRLKIAIETAEALAYMHSTTQIIHRDIKPSNILLNDEFTAKISDFGISRLVPLGQTHLSTSVIGTIGYVDPEYFRTSKLTEKSDVYSFGVVLMELLTGKKIHSLEIPLTAHKGAAAFLNSLLERHALLLVLDERIKKDEYVEVVKCVAKIAIDCLDLEGMNRPTMQDVKQELEQLKSVFFSTEAESI